MEVIIFQIYRSIVSSSAPSVDREFDEIQETINSPIEIFEYDTEGRIISSRFIEREYHSPLHLVSIGNLMKFKRNILIKIKHLKLIRMEGI